MRARPFVLVALWAVVPLFLFFPAPPVRTAAYLVVLVWGAGWLYGRLVSRKLASYRVSQATRLFYGEEGHVDIWIENGSRLPAPFLLVEDKPDFFLNYFGRQLFLVSLKGREKRRIRYTLRGNKRGQFLLRDWAVSSSDLFGLSTWLRTFGDRRVITVFPRVFPLSRFHAGYRQPFGEIKNRYPIFEETTRPRGVRPYQSGDERRRINWKLSARTGDLYVNQYEPSVSQRTLVALDYFLGDYDFRFREFYVELALELAASLCAQLSGRGQAIGLATHATVRELTVETQPDGGVLVNEHEETREISLPPAAGPRQYLAILDLLALVHAQDARPFGETLARLDRAAAGGACLSVLVPDLDDALAARLLALREAGQEVVVYIFGPTPRVRYRVASLGVPVYYAKRDEGLITLEALGG